MELWLNWPTAGEAVTSDVKARPRGVSEEGKVAREVGVVLCKSYAASPALT